MGFYSFIVVAPGEVSLPEYLIYLDHGRNVFNATVDDIDEFRRRLSDQGVKILQENRLDQYDPLDAVEQDLFDDSTSSSR
jgi:hypothetical protein